MAIPEAAAYGLVVMPDGKPAPELLTEEETIQFLQLLAVKKNIIFIGMNYLPGNEFSAS